MTTQDHIDALEREARLATPVARKGGTGRPLAFVALGLVGAAAMSWTLGSAAGGPGLMTDPTAEDWVVSAAVLQMPGERPVESKLGGRIVLDEPADDDGMAEDLQSEELTAIETFVPPEPDVLIAAPPTPPEAFIDEASTKDGTGMERDQVPRMAPGEVEPVMTPFQLVARVPSDADVTNDRPRLPSGMAERGEEPSADDETSDVRLPSGMPSGGSSDRTETEAGTEGVEVADDGRWTRYRSEMVVFDQSDPKNKTDEAADPTFLAPPPPPALGLFPGDPNQ